MVDERTLKRRQAAQTAREQKIQQMGKENYDQMRRDEERERRLRQRTQKAAAAAAEAQEENEGGETAPADDPAQPFRRIAAGPAPRCTSIWTCPAWGAVRPGCKAKSIT